MNGGEDTRHISRDGRISAAILRDFLMAALRQRRLLLPSSAIRQPKSFSICMDSGIHDTPANCSSFPRGYDYGSGSGLPSTNRPGSTLGGFHTIPSSSSPGE